jgi:hypothetical protein
MSFSLSFHQPLLGLSGAHWLDDPSDASCKDSTRQHAVDDPQLSCKQQVGGSSPPASSQRCRSKACDTRRLTCLTGCHCGPGAVGHHQMGVQQRIARPDVRWSKPTASSPAVHMLMSTMAAARPQVLVQVGGGLGHAGLVGGQHRPAGRREDSSPRDPRPARPRPPPRAASSSPSLARANAPLVHCSPWTITGRAQSEPRRFIRYDGAWRRAGAGARRAVL